MAPGKYTLLVFEDNKRLCCRPKLTFHGVEMSAFTSPHYLMQALELRDLSELDLRLKDAFNDSLPGDRGLDNVFQRLPPPDLAGTCTQQEGDKARERRREGRREEERTNWERKWGRRGGRDGREGKEREEQKAGREGK